MKKHLSIFGFGCLCVSLAFSQTPAHVDSYTPDQLLQLAEPLHTRADASSGTASSILANYPGHYSMLVYRDKNGEVEVHQHFADVMLILRGEAKLVTGGTTQCPKTIKAGEIRGKSILGGSSLPLAPGVVAHIPANTPHQLLIPAGGAITYLVVKVQTDPS